MARGVVWFEIGGKNGGKTRDFYSKLFNWDFQFMPGMDDYGMINPEGDKVIGGGVGSTQPGVPPYVTIYIQSTDLAADCKKAEALGGKVVLPPTEIPGGMGSFAWIADPDGVVVGVHKGGQ